MIMNGNAECHLINKNVIKKDKWQQFIIIKPGYACLNLPK